MPNSMTIKGGGGGISQAAVQALIDASIADVEQFKIPMDNVLINSWFDQTVRNNAYFAGSGSADFYQTEFRQQTGATAGSASTAYKSFPSSQARILQSKKQQINFDVTVNSPTDNVLLCYFTCLTKLTDVHYGFEISGGKLKGSTGSGTAQSTVDLESLAAGGFNKTWSLKAIYYPGVKVEFFVNNVLLGTITTNLPPPSGSMAQIMFCSTRNSTSAENKTTTYGHWSFLQEE